MLQCLTLINGQELLWNQLANQTVPIYWVYWYIIVSFSLFLFRSLLFYPRYFFIHSETSLIANTFFTHICMFYAKHSFNWVSKQEDLRPYIWSNIWRTVLTNLKCCIRGSNYNHHLRVQNKLFDILL